MKSSLIAFAACLMSGCSLFVGHTQDLTIHAEPDTATIYLNGEEIGQGQVTKRVKRNKMASILVTNPGYASQTTQVNTTLSSTGVADIVGGILILLPAIGLVSPGAWDLQQSTVMVQLDKKE